jgi:hypothetical protein
MGSGRGLFCFLTPGLQAFAALQPSTRGYLYLTPDGVFCAGWKPPLEIDLRSMAEFASSLSPAPIFSRSADGIPEFTTETTLGLLKLKSGAYDYIWLSALGELSLLMICVLGPGVFCFVIPGLRGFLRRLEAAAGDRCEVDGRICFVHIPSSDL